MMQTLTHAGAAFERGDVLSIGGEQWLVASVTSTTTLTIRPATWFWRAVSWFRWKARDARDAVLDWWYTDDWDDLVDWWQARP